MMSCDRFTNRIALELAFPVDASSVFQWRSRRPARSNIDHPNIPITVQKPIRTSPTFRQHLQLQLLRFTSEIHRHIQYP